MKYRCIAAGDWESWCEHDGSRAIVLCAPFDVTRSVASFSRARIPESIITKRFDRQAWRLGVGGIPDEFVYVEEGLTSNDVENHMCAAPSRFRERLLVETIVRIRSALQDAENRGGRAAIVDMLVEHSAIDEIRKIVNGCPLAKAPRLDWRG